MLSVVAEKEAGSGLIWVDTSMLDESSEEGRAE